jgi:hypothetical protein
MAVRDSADEISQGKPLAISDKIWINDPNENQFLSWILRQGVKEPVFNHAYGHLEDAPYPNWVQYTGADESDFTAVDNLAITNAMARLVLGSRTYNPRTGEIIRYDANPDSASETQGATRNFGSSATDWMNNGDFLLIIPPAHYEGFTMGSGMTNTKVYKSFTTGIISYPVIVTDTEYAERARGGNPFTRALGKSWKQSKDQMEGGVIFGASYEDNTGTFPIRAQEGILNYISTNVYAVGGTMTRQDLWDIIGEWSLYNKKGGAIVCSKAFIHMVTNWAFQKVEYNQETKKDGLDIQQILTPDGLFDLIECDLFNQQEDLMGTILLVPYGKIKYRPLIGDMNLDIKYRPVPQPEIHQQMGEIYGEYGWEFFEEETFGAITGLQF